MAETYRSGESYTKSSTHRFGCETNKAIWELYKNTVRHYVLDPTKQLCSNFNFREVFGNYSFIQ